MPLHSISPSPARPSPAHRLDHKGQVGKVPPPPGAAALLASIRKHALDRAAATGDDAGDGDGAAALLPEGARAAVDAVIHNLSYFEAALPSVEPTQCRRRLIHSTAMRHTRNCGHSSTVTRVRRSAATHAAPPRTPQARLQKDAGVSAASSSSGGGGGGGGSHGGHAAQFSRQRRREARAIL